MVTPGHRIEYSLADYLALEASSNVKHEYLAGQIYAMPGGTPEHAALAAAVRALEPRSPCASCTTQQANRDVDDRPRP